MKKFILVLTLIMAIFTLGCNHNGNEDTPIIPTPPPANELKLPAALQNTNWIHKDNHKVQFTNNGVKAINASSGTESSFILKDQLINNEINQTILYFGENQLTDFIVYRNDVVNSVSLLDINKTGDWQIDDGSGVYEELVSEFPPEIQNTNWIFQIDNSKLEFKTSTVNFDLSKGEKGIYTIKKIKTGKYFSTYYFKENEYDYMDFSKEFKLLSIDFNNYTRSTYWKKI